MFQTTDKRVPSLWLGILFLFLHTPLYSASLPYDLFNEGQWKPCRREAFRQHITQPEDSWSLFFYAAAGLRGNILPQASREQLKTLALPDNSSDRKIKGAALYELGFNAWLHKEEHDAWRYLSEAFSFHETEGLYKNAGCLLYIMHRSNPKLARPSDQVLINQLRSMLPLWTKKRIVNNLQQREALEPKTSTSGKPSTWVVAFYRSQISPAIGSRCTLHPSCSEYFLQASKSHGLLGIPLIGDRLVREPGVVSQAQHRIMINGKQRITDPLHKHLHP